MALSRPGGRRRATPPTLIVLVRHGTTTTTGKELPGRAPGLHLSDVGEQQAKTAAARLTALHDGKKRQVSAIYASPLERTRETAAPIAEAAGLEVQVDDGLLELDIGEWTGMELAAAFKKPEWKTIQRYPSGFRFPGGESFADMQARMVTTLERLRREHPGGTVIAVSHADPIRVAVAHALGTHLDLFQRIVIAPCSLTAVLYGDDGPTVLTVNSTDDARAFVPQ
jgi:probable phosphoglycerate mutase